MLHSDKGIEFDGKSFTELGFPQVPDLVPRDRAAGGNWLACIGDAAGSGAVLAVDLSWGLQTNSATAKFENWMGIAQDLASRLGIFVVSLYNRQLLIDEQLLAALRGHPGVLILRGGAAANPHWLPAGLLTRGTLRQQVDHWLGAIAPELTEIASTAAHAVEGSDPMWLLKRPAEEPDTAFVDGRDRWKIRCFGRLRIYRNDGSQLNWEIALGATRKTKTLFAYLLQNGGRGASTDELADLLWPKAESIAAARNRLYHTVKCLRGGNDAQTRARQRTRYLLRDGSRYVLVPPERSWLDISTFKQLCRQSQNHIRSGASDEALICLGAADRLYTGDLFEDIPAEYTDDSERDWCWSKRYWLRDMFSRSSATPRASTASATGTS